MERLHRAYEIANLGHARREKHDRIGGSPARNGSSVRARGRREEKRCRRGERGEAAQRSAPREAVRRARVAAPAGDAADAALDAAAGGSLPPIDQT